MPPPPVARRTLFAAALAAAGGVAAAVLAGCGDDESRGEAGTLSLFKGTLPPDGPDIVLRPTRSGGRLVAMVGDSITVGSTAALEAASSSLGIDLVVNAKVGRRITVGSNPASGIDAVNELLGDVGEPDLWVIALGSNDVGKYAGVAEYSAQINELLALIPKDAPLVWINVYLRDHPDASALFNRALTDTLTARGHASVGAWTEYATDDGILSDGIHPTPDGRIKFADLVSGQIEDWITQLS